MSLVETIIFEWLETELPMILRWEDDDGKIIQRIIRKRGTQ